MNRLLNFPANFWTNIARTHEGFDRITNLFGSALPNLMPAKITVQKSKIHGDGVFTLEKIPNHSVVTFYPSHCYRV